MKTSVWQKDLTTSAIAWVTVYATLVDETFGRKLPAKNMVLGLIFLEISSVKIFLSSYKVLPRET